MWAVIPLSISLVSVTVGVTSHAEEATARPLVVTVDQETPLEGDQVRAAIGRELGVPVVALSGHGARDALGTLTITPSSMGRLLFVFRRPTGAEVWRLIDLGEDQEAMLRSIALLAVNLVNDQTSQLLGDLVPSRSPGPAAQEPAIEAEPCEEPAPPPPPVPRRRALREVIGEVRQQAFEVPWSTELQVVQAFVANTISPRFELGAQRALGASRIVGLGLEVSGGRFTGCVRSECIEVGQYSFVVASRLRIRAPSLILELGLALGLRLDQSRGQWNQSNHFSPLGQIRITMVIPVYWRLSLVVTNTAATTFRSIEAAGIYSQLNIRLWEYSLGVGVRILLG